MTNSQRTTNPQNAHSSGAALTAVVIYENARTLPNTSLHYAFDCQLYGVQARAGDDPIVANLRYFNRDRLKFSTETGAMVIKANVTVWPGEPAAALHLDSEGNGLSEKDFSLIGDIKWVLPLTSVEGTFDFEHLQAPVISASGTVTLSQDEVQDAAYDAHGKVAIFEMVPFQYTSYFPHDSTPHTLPLKAFFRHSNKRYEHGVPLPFAGRIVHVDGTLHDIHCDPKTGRPEYVVIEVEDINSLGQGILPPAPKKSTGASGQGSHKRKFAFDPASLNKHSTAPAEGSAANAQTSTSESPVSTLSDITSDSVEGNPVASPAASSTATAPPAASPSPTAPSRAGGGPGSGSKRARRARE